MEFNNEVEKVLGEQEAFMYFCVWGGESSDRHTSQVICMGNEFKAKSKAAEKNWNLFLVWETKVGCCTLGGIEWGLLYLR